MQKTMLVTVVRPLTNG